MFYLWWTHCDGLRCKSKEPVWSYGCVTSADYSDIYLLSIIYILASSILGLSQKIQKVNVEYCLSSVRLSIEWHSKVEQRAALLDANVVFNVRFQLFWTPFSVDFCTDQVFNNILFAWPAWMPFDWSLLLLFPRTQCPLVEELRPFSPHEGASRKYPHPWRHFHRHRLLRPEWSSEPALTAHPSWKEEEGPREGGRTRVAKVCTLKARLNFTIWCDYSCSSFVWLFVNYCSMFLLIYFRDGLFKAFRDVLLFFNVWHLCNQTSPIKSWQPCRVPQRISGGGNLGAWPARINFLSFIPEAQVKWRHRVKIGAERTK